MTSASTLIVLLTSWIWLSVVSASDSSRCRAFLPPQRNTVSTTKSAHRYEVSSSAYINVLRGGGGADTDSDEPNEKKEVDKDEEVTPSNTKTATASKPTKRTKPKASKQAKAHLARPIASTNPNYRIQRELKEFIKDPPSGLSVQVGKNLRVWIVTIEGPGIYQGESFRLRIAFPPQYPVVPPSVYFLPPHLPVGPHFYTNGDICLSLLGKDWRPTMTAQSIALSILSMLASTPKKVMPMDNAAHAHNKPGQYQKDWVYHDDNC